MTSPSKNRSKQRHRARSQAHGAEPPRDLSPPQSVDEIIAARPTPPLTVERLFEKWAGVFEPDFWEEVRRGARSGEDEVVVANRGQR